MGQTHSARSEDLRQTTKKTPHTMNKFPNSKKPGDPPQPPPVYSEHRRLIVLPQKHMLVINENVNLVMEEVLNKLEAELEGSPGLLDAAGHIRESCIVTATTVARSMLPNIAHKDLHEDLMKCEVRLQDLLFDLKSTIVVENQVAIGMIWASAVTRVAYQTRSDSKDYRTGIWVAILVEVVHKKAADLGLVEFNKIRGVTKV